MAMVSVLSCSCEDMENLSLIQTRIISHVNTSFIARKHSDVWTFDFMPSKVLPHDFAFDFRQWNRNPIVHLITKLETWFQEFDIKTNKTHHYKLKLFIHWRSMRFIDINIAAVTVLLINMKARFQENTQNEHKNQLQVWNDITRGIQALY